MTSESTPMFELAVSSEMVFTDLPIEERVRTIDREGFLVEIWDWTAKDLHALAATGARFSSMTGYVTGALADEDGAEELLRTAAQAVEASTVIDCPRLNLHAAPRARGSSRGLWSSRRSVSPQPMPAARLAAGGAEVTVRYGRPAVPLIHFKSNH